MPGVSFAFPPALSAVCIDDANRTPRIVIKELANARRKWAIGLALASIAAVGAIGCGAGSEGDYGGKHPDYAKALAGSPPPLAALHRQADQLLPGGLSAYESRIASLKGYPVVVNVWASWCGPCRFEFPAFQQVSAAYGKRVAFFGVNSQDSDDGAETFLGEAPVPYPSYTDGDKSIADELGGLGFPKTAFYGRNGELIYLDQKPYVHAAELRADVKRYALGEGSESG
jgi:cytochrome c biogenesis protein CcmG, thiol:disulfide interchange protein DsbE